jgi:hypothetical protein
MKWRLHIEMIEAKAFRTFIRIYSLIKSERLSANIKLTLHKALIRSVMTYACPPGNLRQNVTYWNCSACKIRFSAPLAIFRGAHRFTISMKLPYIYDYMTKSCRQQAEIIQNHENVRYIGHGEARHRKYKRLKLRGGHVYDCSSV